MKGSPPLRRPSDSLEANVGEDAIGLRIGCGHEVLVANCEVVEGKRIKKPIELRVVKFHASH